VWEIVEECGPAHHQHPQLALFALSSLVKLWEKSEWEKRRRRGGARRRSGQEKKRG
jgi:hypothetical protein